MNAHDPNLIEPILHTIKGEPPLAGMGKHFRDDQGAELFEPHRPEHRSSIAIIGVLELDDGRWLARDRGFSIDGPIFPTRDQALRCSIARRIKQFRKFGRQTDGIHWEQGIVERMVEWALSLKPHVDFSDQPVGQETRHAQRHGDREAPQPPATSHDSNITDPVVAELYAANRAREVFPAGHTVHMTLNYSDADRVLSVGACDCGATFQYPQSQHARMDAAIEAHWQKFDHLPDKVDGRGNPLTESTNDAEGAVLPASPEPACVEVSPDALPGPHAGSSITDGNDPDDDSWMLRLAETLAWRDEPEASPLDEILKRRGGGQDDALSRPMLRWHGGKWKLAPWIMGFFPDHRIYVEPFGGAGSVLLRKLRVYAEIYNDLDDVVVNLFRVLRDDAKAKRLIDALRLTPFAREEFNEALEAAEDDVERARHLIVRSYMGFGSNAHSSSPVAAKTAFKTFTRPDDYRSTGFRANSNRSGTTPAHDWANYPDTLPAIVERLRGVIVEQRPAMDVMKQHDGPATLHYVDPPYLPETRSPANKYDLKHRMYRHELSVDDHAELLTFLQTLEGFVVLSGYPSPMYDDALPTWRRVTCAALADGARERTEVLWLNPVCAAALDEKHPTLFNLAAIDVANTPPRK